MVRDPTLKRLTREDKVVSVLVKTITMVFDQALRKKDQQVPMLKELQSRMLITLTVHLPTPSAWPNSTTIYSLAI